MEQWFFLLSSPSSVPTSFSRPPLRLSFRCPYPPPMQFLYLPPFHNGTALGFSRPPLPPLTVNRFLFNPPFRPLSPLENLPLLFSNLLRVLFSVMLFFDWILFRYRLSCLPLTPKQKLSFFYDQTPISFCFPAHAPCPTFFVLLAFSFPFPTPPFCDFLLFSN